MGGGQAYKGTPANVYSICATLVFGNACRSVSQKQRTQFDFRLDICGGSDDSIQEISRYSDPVCPSHLADGSRIRAIYGEYSGSSPGPERRRGRQSIHPTAKRCHGRQEANEHRYVRQLSFRKHCPRQLQDHGGGFRVLQGRGERHCAYRAEPEHSHLAQGRIDVRIRACDHGGPDRGHSRQPNRVDAGK